MIVRHAGGHDSPMTDSTEIETSWTAEPFVPASSSLRRLQCAVQDCKGKHFEHEDRGKRRLHEKPNDAEEIRAALVEDLRRANELAGVDA